MYKKLKEHLDKLSSLLEENKDKFPSEESEEAGEIVSYMDGDPGEDDGELFEEKAPTKHVSDKKMFD
jgi:hypothetical protein